MRTILCLLIAPLLLGCGAQPAPEFFGSPGQSLVWGGRDYTLYRKGDRFEVIRLGYAASGQHAGIREDMLALTEAKTGCKVISHSLQGDSGEMRGSLRC